MLGNDRKPAKTHEKYAEKWGLERITPGFVALVAVLVSDNSRFRVPAKHRSGCLFAFMGYSLWEDR